MAANAELKIILDTVYKGHSASQRAERDVQQLEKAVKKQREELEKGQATALKASKAIAGFGLAAVGVTVALFNQGAELTTTIGKYDALAESIGSNADLLLGRMRDATNGYISDADLMRGASELINVGIAGSGEEVERFSAVIGGLGVDMQQLTLTIVNQSKMRLDALGLSVSDVDDKYQKLRETLPDAEAWKIAVLESLEDKMAVMGGTISDADDAMRRLKTSFDNARDAAAVAVAEGFTPTAEVLALILERNADLEGAGGFAGWLDFAGQKSADAALALDALSRGTISLGDAFKLLGTAQGASAEWETELAEIRSEQIGILERAARRTGEYGLEVEYAARAEARASRERRRSEQAMRGSETALERLASVTEAWGGANTKAIENMQTARENTEQTAAAHERYAEAIAASNAEMGQLFAKQTEIADDELLINNTNNVADALWNAAAAADADTGKLVLLGLATGKFSEEEATAYLKSAALQIKIDELGKLIAGGMSIPDALQHLQDFQTDLENTSGDAEEVAKQLGFITEQADGLDGRSVRFTITAAYLREGNVPPGMEGVTNPDGTIQGTATGSPSLRGVSMVGEFGPEIVQGSGQRIVSTNNTRNITQNMSLTGRQSSVTVYNYLRQQSRRKGMVN